MTLAPPDPGTTTIPPPAPAEAEPYIGLRPYSERERTLFFGRDEDAVRLRNKIFADQITVLYAPSGVGKTSLLKTLVVPDLRAQDAVVVYFDDWREQSTAPLKAAIQAAGAAEGAPTSPEPGASLVQVAEMVVKAAERPLILVLDQFETFLILHAWHLDPLRSELAALVRSNVDAHVVLALREEFLAPLDVFRDRISTLFRSTYRLLPLIGEGAEKAIVRPAEMFDGSYDPLLLKALLEDLRISSRFEADPAAGHGGGVDLPFLQIVCQRLWRQAVAAGSRQLTLESYQKLGRCEGIIRSYVDQVVAAVPRKNWNDMAKVLDYLAPHSGAKMAYAVSDLAKRTHVPEKGVADLLQHFHSHWVLRSRPFGDTRTYELYHDSFIKILRPWVDQQLWRARRNRMVVKSLGAGLAAALVVFGTTWWEERKRTTGVLEALADPATKPKNAANRQDYVTQGVDDVARYLVGKGDDRSLKRLAGLLQDHRDMVTRLYARPATTEGNDYIETAEETAPNDSQGPDQESSPMQRSTARQEQGGSTSASLARRLGELTDRMQYAGVPLVLLYGPEARSGDTTGFLIAWMSLAEQLLDSLGLPAPLAIPLRFSSAAPSGTIQVVSAQPSGTLIEPLPVLWKDDSVVVRQDSLPGNVQQHFFAQPRQGWRRLSPTLPGGPWWVVPRWTLPIWRASGQSPRSQPELVALATAVRVIESPDLLFTPHATPYLLQRGRRESELAVDHALAARGVEGIRQVFIALARAQRPLLPLGPLLDVMADYPDENPEQMAARLSREPWLQLSGMGARAARGPKPAVAAPSTEPDSSSIAGFIYPSAVLGEPVRLVRVYIGDSLVPRLAYEGRGDLRPEVLWAISDLRGDLFRRHGLSVPGVSFRPDTNLPANGFRVELLTQTPRDPGAVTRIVGGDSAFHEVVTALGPPLVASRLHWLTSELAQSLTDTLPPNQRAWIESKFSTYDLKLLLRAVVAPSPEELKRSEAAPALDQTIAQAGWLLPALVFWDRTGGISDLNRTARLLRRTQQGRLQAEGVTPPTGPIAAAVERGIVALEADRVKTASEAFRSAAATDRTAAEQAFVVLYGRRAAPQQLARLARECRLAEPGEVHRDTADLSDTRRAELEEVLSAPGLTDNDADLRRRLQQCVMREHVAVKRFDRAGSVFDQMVSEAGDMKWKPDDAYRVAHWILTEPKIGGSPARFASAQRLMLEAMSDRTALGNAEGVTGELAWVCASSTAMRGCHAMLDSIITRDSLDFHLPFSVGQQLAGRAVSRRDAEWALDLLNRTSARLSSAREHRPWYEAQTRMSRAKANLTLVGHGKKSSAEAAVADLEALLSELKGYTYKEPSKAQVYSTLVDVHVAAGRIDSAEAVFNRDTEVASDSTLRGTSYFLSLARGQLDSAREVADTMLAADSTDGSALFLASVSRLLAGDTNAVVPAIRFLDETEHEYRDYVRLMLSWSLRSRGESDRARAIINQRWNEVDSSTWPRRIEQGDVSAWREMLIGYYAGHVPRARIFGPLANESSYQSGALHALGYPLNAARCEAYFYDALLQSVSGLTWTRRKRELAALDAAIATRYYQYYEYHMAHILRERLTGTKRPSPSATLASSF